MDLLMEVVDPKDWVMMDPAVLPDLCSGNRPSVGVVSLLRTPDLLREWLLC